MVLMSCCPRDADDLRMLRRSDTGVPCSWRARLENAAGASLKEKKDGDLEEEDETKKVTCYMILCGNSPARGHFASIHVEDGGEEERRRFLFCFAKPTNQKLRACFA